MTCGVMLETIQRNERADFLTMAEQHFREINPKFVPAPDWQHSYFEKIRQNPGVRLRWIVVDGRHAGFIVSGVEEHRFLPRKSGAIYELYVVPELRKKGIARACAQQVIDELRTQAISKIQLEVWEGNLAAARLWQSLGFEKVTERFVLSGPSGTTE